MNKNLELYKYSALALVVFLMPNISFYVVAKLLDLDRVWLNVDYFLPLLFLAFNRRFIFFAIFILVACIDFLLLFGQIFPIIRINDILYLLKFSWISSSIYKIYGSLVLFIILLNLFTTYKIYNKKINFFLLVIFNVTILIYAVIINTNYKGSSNTGKFWKPKIGLVSSLVVDYLDYYDSGFLNTYNMEGEAFDNVQSIGATRLIWKNTDTDKYNKILLVVNESWGVPNDFEIQEDILSPILNNEKLKNIEVDEFSFQGFTIAGELRELCQKRPIHFNLKKQMTGFEECLPHYYKNLGYETIAVHGALSSMYDRQYWYPRVGFDELLFRDTGLNLESSFCHSFPGNCDKDISNVVSKKFKESENIFLYWLTLNTHASYDLRDLDLDLFDCDKFNVQKETASCRNLKLQKQFFFNISNILSNEEFSGTKVIIVGDHEPPIISSEKKIFIKEKVPAIDFNVI